MPHLTRHLATVLLGGLMCMAGGGCNYQTQGDFNPDANRSYQWRSLYREDIQTVAVPIFASRSFQRGVESSLTKAVVSQLEARSPYKVVARERAQTILEGEIDGVDVTTLSQDGRSTLPQEQLVTLRVNFIWKDLRTGRILAERKGFSQTAAFYPTLGESRVIGTQQAVEGLAIAIVQQLEADW